MILASTMIRDNLQPSGLDFAPTQDRVAKSEFRFSRQIGRGRARH
jgi:hypothetical protein